MSSVNVENYPKSVRLPEGSEVEFRLMQLADRDAMLLAHAIQIDQVEIERPAFVPGHQQVADREVTMPEAGIVHPARGRGHGRG